MKNKAALLAIMASAGGISFPMHFSKDDAPKNKLNLSEEEIEQLKTMTPKQKKKFLKGRK